jgi:hypothetical protein
MATISSSSSTFMGNALGPNTSGCFDWVLSDVDADNAFGLIITDANTITSGYLQGYYVSLATTGSYTTGSTQVNGFAVDLTWVGGTIGCEFSGMYIYMAGSGSPTLTSANISGLNIYMGDLGGAPSSKSCIQMHVEDDGTATGQSAFIVARMEGASAAIGAFIEFAGTAALAPTYFIKSNSASGSMYYGSYTPTAVTGISLKCLINGAVYHIPLVASTSAA